LRKNLELFLAIVLCLVAATRLQADDDRRVDEALSSIRGVDPLHPKLPDGVCPYRSLAFLPVHQGIEESELEAEIDAIRSAVRDGAAA
jgi:hypothetical protein